MKIKELEITKKMYNKAKEIENTYEELRKLDCKSEEFKELRKKIFKLEDKYEEEVSDEFLSLEIVNEYERRKRILKENKKVKKMNIKELEITIAHGLENALNMMNDDTYEVRYDVCESCLTEIFENGKCIHIIKNDELVPNFNITDLLNGKMDIK